MIAHWEIDNFDVKVWRELVEANLANPYVVNRIKRNVQGAREDLSRESVWFALVMCQVTTQQKSGPTSIASQFLESGSASLSYQKLVLKKNREEFIKKELERHRLRWSSKIAKNLFITLDSLEDGEWDRLFNQLNSLSLRTTNKKELVVANYLQSCLFPGIGPKQSRNLIQWLGLSRYAIPIDSRFTRTLRKMGSSYVPGANALSDESTYRFVEQGIQEISRKIKIYPCVLDACVFSSFDRVDA